MSLFRQATSCFRNYYAVKDLGGFQIIRGFKRWLAPTLIELEKRRKKVGPLPPQKRSTYLEWNYEAEICAFAKRVQEEFDKNLLRRAFIHRSYVIEQELKQEDPELVCKEDNSELINEGDKLLSNYITEKFKDKYLADAVEAIVTYLTAEKMLAHVADHLGTADLVLSADFPVEQTTLANTFKAIIGALDQSVGDDRTKLFINDFLICQLNGKELYDIWDLKNPYQYLLELSKQKGIQDIEPRLCNKSASNTILSNYQVGLYNNKKLIGIGWGESVEIAKDAAALDAIQKIQNMCN